MRMIDIDFHWVFLTLFFNLCPRVQALDLGQAIALVENAARCQF
jgi:hypothetical protein